MHRVRVTGKKSILGFVPLFLILIGDRSLLASQLPDADLPILVPMRDWVIEREQGSISIEGRLHAVDDGDYLFSDRSGNWYTIFEKEFSQEDRALVAEALERVVPANQSSLDQAWRRADLRYFKINETLQLVAMRVRGLAGRRVMIENEFGDHTILANEVFQPGDLLEHVRLLRKRQPDWDNQPEYQLPTNFPKDADELAISEPSEELKALLKAWLRPKHLLWKQEEIKLAPGERILDLDRDGDVFLISNAQGEYSTWHQPSNRRFAIPKEALTRAAIKAPDPPTILLDNDNQSVWIVESESVVQWDLASGKKRASCGQWNGVLAARYSNDYAHLGVIDDKGMAHLIDTRTANVNSFPTQLSVSPYRENPQIRSFLLSDDGSSLTLSLGKKFYR